jgi:hypothetical protein
LSITEFRLSLFLKLLKVDASKNIFYQNYNNKLITDNKYDKDFYLYRKKMVGLPSLLSVDRKFKHQNKVILDYLDNNYYIYLYISLVNIIRECLNLQFKLKSCQSNLDRFNSNLDNKETKLKIDDNVNVVNVKRKGGLTGQIKKLIDKRKGLLNETEELNSQLYKLNERLDVNYGKCKELFLQILRVLEVLGELDEKDYNSSYQQIELDFFKKEVDFSLLSNEFKMDSTKSLAKFFRRSLMDNNHYIQKRYYHSNVNNYSIKKKISPYKDYSLDSPLFKELNRIIIESKLNVDTQLRIEKFLLYQSQMLFKENIDKNLDLNYHFLTPDIFKELKNSINILNNLIKNLRENINLTDVNIEGNNLIRIKLFNQLIHHIENEVIISLILGRLLRIISNKNIINNNTIFTEVAIDLAVDWINHYFYAMFKYKKSLNAFHINDYNDNNNISNNKNKKVSINIDENIDIDTDSLSQ